MYLGEGGFLSSAYVQNSLLKLVGCLGSSFPEDMPTSIIGHFRSTEHGYSDLINRQDALLQQEQRQLYYKG